MEVLKLSEAKIGKTYKVIKVNILGKELLNQLNNIGLSENQKITLLQTNYRKKSFIVKVMGVNFAIDRKICEKVEVQNV